MDSRLQRFAVPVKSPADGERPLPSETVEGELYVCESDGCVQFKCPCGCGMLRQIPIGPPWPRWWGFVRHEDNTITLSPSILHLEGCKSHYFIERNCVRWC